MSLRLMLAAGAMVGAVATHVMAAGLSQGDVNGATFSETVDYQSRAAVVRAQVLLDRLGISPGVIDGQSGENFASALRAFQRHNEIEDSGTLDAPTWALLVAGSAAPSVIAYRITAADTRGPFAPEIPASLEGKTGLKHLAFTGPREMFAERFHMDERLLDALNPGVALDKAGETILVANVERAPFAATITRIEVEKSQRVVRSYDGDGRLVAVYPASIGSAEKPAPTGTLKIMRIVRNPVYYYDPRFNFAGVEASRRLKIAPGPNNPVGSVWMNLNARSYGIHGTAEPEKVGRVGSHGCVRMTNWDASALAGMVRKGTTVVFLD